MHIVFIDEGAPVDSIPDMTYFFKSHELRFMQGVIIFSDYSESKKIVDCLQGKGHVRCDLGLPGHIEIYQEQDPKQKILKASAMHGLIFFIGSSSEILLIKELFPETTKQLTI